MRRLAIAVALCCALLGISASASSASTDYGRPYHVTHCAPALYPNTKYRACETIDGQGDYIRYIEGAWMAWETNIGWPIPRWSFHGYGLLTASSYRVAYGPLNYSGFRITRYWWNTPIMYVNRYVKAHSQMCSYMMTGNNNSHATVCFNAP